jgi:hypothetical protein
MTVRMPIGRMMSAGAIVVASALLLLGVASARGAVVYNNLNTVPTTVNGLPDQDTYSAAPFEFPFGGAIEIAPGTVKRLTVDLDSFTCEHGVYSLENCYTLRHKKFSYGLTADIYTVTAEDQPGELLASSTAHFKIPYRPTTNVSCPATGEGKGFGSNCDVGGFLTKVTFKRFTPAAALPARVIVLFNSTPGDSASDVVNIGDQTAYKGYNSSLSEPYVAEPPLDGGIPAVGSDPFPEDAYVRGALNAGGWEGFQPAMELTVK